LVVLAALAFLPCDIATSAGTLNEVDQWLRSQATVETWSADFVQTRYLKTLVRPLTATGHVWFASPDRFRWEVGQPAATIAVRSGNDLVLVYPALRRAEKYSLSEAQPGPWRDASTLLEIGFPKNPAELERQFETISQSKTNDLCEIVLRPRATAARRLMPRITIVFDPATQALLATELEFADGSRMHNDFSNQKTNQPPPRDAFATDVPEGYRLSEPVKSIR